MSKKNKGGSITLLDKIAWHGQAYIHMREHPYVSMREKRENTEQTHACEVN